MAIEFTEAELEEFKKIQDKYPEKQASLMPLLWMAQNKWGWLSTDVMRYCAYLLELPLAHVEGVANFYTMYFKKPVGKHHIQVCTNVACMLNGGEEIYKNFKEKLKIDNMEVTSDGLYSLEEVECMGACGMAPVVAVNEDFYEHFNISDIDEFINRFKA